MQLAIIYFHQNIDASMSVLWILVFFPSNKKKNAFALESNEKQPRLSIANIIHFAITFSLLHLYTYKHKISEIAIFFANKLRFIWFLKECKRKMMFV